MCDYYIYNKKEGNFQIADEVNLRQNALLFNMHKNAAQKFVKFLQKIDIVVIDK